MINANNPLTYPPDDLLSDRKLLAILATDPLNIVGLAEGLRQSALDQARQESRDDRIGNWRIVSNASGKRYYGAEYPRFFTPDTELGVKDPGFGAMTHAIIDLEGGDQVMLQPLLKPDNGHPEVKIVSTRRMERAAKTGEPYKETRLPLETLRDVLIMPGQRMQLGRDPLTGKAYSTANKVTGITAMMMNDAGKVPADSPDLKEEGRSVDVYNEFHQRLHESREIGGIGRFVLGQEGDRS